MKKILCIFFIFLISLTACKTENYSDEVYIFDILKYDSVKYSKQIEQEGIIIKNSIDYKNNIIHFYEECNDTIFFESYILINDTCSYYIFNKSSNLFYDGSLEENKWYKQKLLVNPNLEGFKNNGEWFSPSVSGIETYLKYILFEYLINNPFLPISENITIIDFIVGKNNFLGYDKSKTLLENLEEKNVNKLKFYYNEKGLYQNNIYKINSKYNPATDTIIEEETNEILATRSLSIKNSTIKKYEINYTDKSISVNVNKFKYNINIPKDFIEV